MESLDVHNDVNSIDIKNWVTKSNNLIESTYKLSLQEQRILLVMASKVQPSDETLKTYRFRASDFIEIIGAKKGTGYYSYLKEVVNGLQTKVLTIKKDGKLRNYSWVITSIYEDKEGYITLQFHPSLKDLFLELKEKFTTYQLENVVRLNSVYSIRIYELLKQYEKIKKRELTLQALRDFLGIEPTKYKQYGHFKNKVLLVAQTEINKKTDIHFDFTEIKTGRKVTSFEFKIHSTKGVKFISDSPDLLDSPVEHKDEAVSLRVQLRNLSVPDEQLDWLLNEFPEDQIRRNIHYVLHRKMKGEIKHIGAYTIKAIQNNYDQGEENSSTFKPSKTPIRTETIPDWYTQSKMLGNRTLEQKQKDYIEQRGSQEEFESRLLKSREVKRTIMKEILKENNEDTINEAVLESVTELLKSDMQMRLDVGMEAQLINDFENLELKEIYRKLVVQLSSKDQ